MRQRSLVSSTSRAKSMSSGRVESQYRVGSVSPSGHSNNSHSAALGSGVSCRCAEWMRTRAKRPHSASAEPSRHGMILQASAAKPQATSLAETTSRSEEHTSELQSRRDLVCRLLLEKKKDT